MALDFEKIEAGIFNHIEKKAKTNIAKAAANNVRKACRIMYKNKVALSYSSVAAFIADIDNYELFEKVNGNIPPKRQSIQNNSSLKSIIDTYKAQQPGRSSSAKTKVKATNQYPSEGLDIKTKHYINLLRQQVDSLQNENKSLAKLIEDNSKSSPISLGLSYDTTEEQAASSLILRRDKSAPNLDSAILNKLSKMPESFPDFFHVKSRNGKSALYIYSPSGDKRIFSSEEWSHLSKVQSDG